MNFEAVFHQTASDCTTVTLVAAAAKGSDVTVTTLTVDVATALAALSKEECVAFLERFLQGEAHLELKLKQRIGLLQPTSDEYNPSGTRTVGELLSVRDEVVQQRRKAAAAAKEAKRRAELAALSSRGDKAWQEVETFIEAKTTDGYKQAATLLQQLGELAREQGHGSIFANRVEQLRQRYSRRSAFIRELQRVQL